MWFSFSAAIVFVLSLFSFLPLFSGKDQPEAHFEYFYFAYIRKCLCWQHNACYKILSMKRLICNPLSWVSFMNLHYFFEVQQDDSCKSLYHKYYERKEQNLLKASHSCVFFSSFFFIFNKETCVKKETCVRKEKAMINKTLLFLLYLPILLVTDVILSCFLQLSCRKCS